MAGANNKLEDEVEGGKRGKGGLCELPFVLLVRRVRAAFFHMQGTKARSIE